MQCQQVLGETLPGVRPSSSLVEFYQAEQQWTF